MRYGFTTGSCSAAAAKAAAYMLLGGRIKEKISIETPKGIMFDADILDIIRTEDYVSCGVRKDGGDDPDITTGSVITAKVSWAEGNGEVIIDGGEGVGRVTMPGLDQMVGNAAINSVPRAMITKEVLEVMGLFDYKKSLKVIISVEGGAELAKKTFNPRLGIIGGISILGTSGIVEPMSVQALLDTIKTELRQKKCLGYEGVVVAPGNYGLDFMKREFAYDLDHAVKCSNFIGDTIDMAAELGFKELLLCGHVGKLVKVSGGIMNTHSANADCRMELMAAAAVLSGADNECVRKILECISTDAAYEVILSAGIEKAVMKHIMKKIAFYLEKKAGGRLKTECIMFSNAYGLLGSTDGAEEMIRRSEEIRLVSFDSGIISY